MSANPDNLHGVNPADLPPDAVIFGGSAAMSRIRRRIGDAVSGDLPVLILGESGTGKEVIARFLHANSDRRDQPFVKLTCTAIRANLLEKELFGSELIGQGGARVVRRGCIEAAGAGTLFLDEIGELDPCLQEELVRLLRERSFVRIGGNEPRPAGARMICTTNSDLHAAVKSGKLREDLFALINNVTLSLPALRERKSDIPQLCDYFLQKLAIRFNRTAPSMSPATLQLLQEWYWPGNLRELENWFAQAIILGDFNVPAAELRRHLALSRVAARRQHRMNPQPGHSLLGSSAMNSAAILRVLQGNHWNRRKTAEELNIGYRSLLFKLREAGKPQRRRSHKGTSFPS